MPIQRTVIGSFPTPPISVPHEEAIRNVVDLQVKYGIDVISDGEQHGSMVEYLAQIPGVELIDRGIRIVKEIRPMDDPDKCWKIEDYKLVRSYLNEKGRANAKVKTTLTGPITLGFFGVHGSLYGGMGPYKNYTDPRLYSDSRKALIPIAQRAIELGAYLQIDEPFLTSMSPENVNEFLNPLLENLPRSAKKEERVSIHVCGQIGKAHYDELLNLDVPVLSIAFSEYQERKNLNVISRESLEHHRKKLGVGFISNAKVEDYQIAFERLKEVSKKAGFENISFVHPDCGLLLTKPEDVEPILRNMQFASAPERLHVESML
jgi:methionine synthase II (cobalamin-independent)